MIDYADGRTERGKVVIVDDLERVNITVNLRDWDRSKVSKRPAYINHHCDKADCPDCKRRKRWAFLFNKYKRSMYWAELLFLARKVFIAATSLFLTSRIITAMMYCITFNIIMLVVIVRRKPYLNDLELLYGEDCGERGKYYGLGTNNALEIFMVISELLLWVAALGNDAMGASSTANEQDALAMMASEYPTGNAICAALEWLGIVMFVCCVLYCFREMTDAFLKDHCVKKKKKKKKKRTKIKLQLYLDQEWTLPTTLRVKTKLCAVTQRSRLCSRPRSSIGGAALRGNPSKQSVATRLLPGYFSALAIAMGVRCHRVPSRLRTLTKKSKSPAVLSP